jgi:hypothetical protein
MPASLHVPICSRATRRCGVRAAAALAHRCFRHLLRIMCVHAFLSAARSPLPILHHLPHAHINTPPRRNQPPPAAADGMSPGKLDWATGRFPSGLPVPPIGRSDADFESLGVEFLDVREGIKVTELNELFEKVGT